MAAATPTPEALRHLVGRYCAAVTSRDVDATVALFTEDAVQRDPANTPPNVGHDAIRAFFESAVQASRQTRMEALRIRTCGEHAAVDFRVTVGLDTGTMVIEGIDVITAAPDGRIAALSAYWDGSDVTMSDSLRS